MVCTCHKGHFKVIFQAQLVEARSAEVATLRLKLNHNHKINFFTRCKSYPARDDKIINRLVAKGWTLGSFQRRLRLIPAWRFRNQPPGAEMESPVFLRITPISFVGDSQMLVQPPNLQRGSPSLRGASQNLTSSR